MKSRVREGPCWLLSTLLHLAVLVMLASLVVPLGERSCLRTLIIEVYESDGEESETTAVQQVVMIQDFDAPDDHQQPTLDPQPEGASNEQSPNEPQPASETETQKRVIEWSLPDLQISSVAVQPGPPVQASPPVQPSPPVHHPPPSVLPCGPDEDSPERQHMDDIVDRFIQYDIGKLKGEAGKKADMEFQRLGPEAVPSLVHGLNKAAGYHQSCPVCVISSKLERALQDTSDPAMIAYALENMGRGVRRNAPHAARVRGLKQRWEAQLAQRRKQIESDLKAHGLPRDGWMWMVDKVHRLTRASRADMEAALSDPDPGVRLAAVLALERRRRAGNSDIAIGRLLTRVVADRDPAVQRTARDTLIQLATGADLGPDARDWSDYWDFVERVREVEVATAEQLVAALDDADWRIRRTAAGAAEEASPQLVDGQRALLGQRLVGLLLDGEPQVRQAAQNALVALAGRDDPGIGEAVDEQQRGQAVHRWREYWQRFERERVNVPRAESLLAMARTLEDHGRAKQAARRYRHIVEEFPTTAAAGEARRRLGSIGRN